MNNEKAKRIFTFWEGNNIPAYLGLCLKTWQKFLPEYKIIILNYSNLDKWLEENYFDKSLYQNFSLPKQADAVRCAVLNRYGGIWLDMDTILTSERIKDILNLDTEFKLIGEHICFIAAKKNAKILTEWEKGIKSNIRLYNCYKKSKIIKFILKIFRSHFVKRLDRWDFLGNSILRAALKKFHKNPDIFKSLDKIKLVSFPEIIWAKENNKSNEGIELYREFYFENDHHDYILENSKGIICLHNSWTPPEYMEMNEEEFLNQNNTLSNLLKKTLNTDVKNSLV